MAKVRGTINLPDTPVGGVYTDDGLFTVIRTFTPLLDFYTDATTTGIVREILYSDSIPSGIFTTSGDKIFFRYAGRYAANANDNKYLFLNVAGADIGESGGQAINGEKWELDGFVIRVSNSILRYEAEFTTTGATPVLREGEATGLDLDNNPITFLLEARTVEAAGDLTATMGTVYFIPAVSAGNDTWGLLGDGWALNGDEWAFNP